MSSSRPNILVICADEFRRDFTGFASGGRVRTPATGRYVHETGHWDNAFPYHGTPISWGHRLRDAGYRVESIGKLHYRSAADDDGFSAKHDAMYVAGGVGEIIGAIRDDLPVRRGRAEIESAGPGESDYIKYDRRIAAQASDWLESIGGRSQPWALFVSFASPHPPFAVTSEFRDLYASDDLPLPVAWRREEWPDHVVLNEFRRYFGWDGGFTEPQIRQVIAVYYGLCSFVDAQVGIVLDSLAASGCEQDTVVIFTSDHGAMLGARGLFGKFQMYEESCGIPLMVAGPGFGPGRVCGTPVSIVDLHPTIVRAAGLEPSSDLPGKSLASVAEKPDHPRVVLSEYHAAGSTRATFMVTDGRRKYVHHLAGPDQFFDLDFDPDERDDFAGRGAEVAAFDSLRSRLQSLVDPEAADLRAHADQAALIERHGGREAVIAGGRRNSATPGGAFRTTHDREPAR